MAARKKAGCKKGRKDQGPILTLNQKSGVWTVVLVHRAKMGQPVIPEIPWGSPLPEVVWSFETNKWY